MENILEIYEKQLKEEKEKLQKIIDKLTPLENERAEYEEEIKALTKLISIKSKRSTFNREIEPSISTVGRVAGKTALKAYASLIMNDFKGKSFKEKDIRELATKEGLNVNNQPITESFSRGILATLLGKDFLEKIDIGTYRYKD